MEHTVFVIDGQHRVAALNAALDRLKPRHIQSDSQVDGALKDASSRSLWIVFQAKSVARLVERVASVTLAPKASLGTMIVLDDVPSQSIAVCSLLFRRVISEPTFQLLDRGQFLEALAAPNADELIIGGMSDLASRTLSFVTGAMRTVVVPWRYFRSVPGVAKPDPHRLELADYGHTVRLGDYEASAASILYVYDAEYRKRAKAARRQKDRTFGASVQRLRRLRGLRQSDFPTLSEKTIARIERGEVKEPEKETVEKIAGTLGVQVSDIEKY